MKPDFYDAYIQLGLLNSKKPSQLAAKYYDDAIRLDTLKHAQHRSRISCIERMARDGGPARKPVEACSRAHADMGVASQLAGMARDGRADCAAAADDQCAHA